MTLLAYHNNPDIKTAILAQLAAHREADEIVKGTYWERGKGCAVGCTLHNGNHAEYEMRFGIPQSLARLEDRLFEGLPSGNAKLWPERFMRAFEPGRDYSLVVWTFLHWILTDKAINPGIDHSRVRDSVKQCADVIFSISKWAESDESAEAAAGAAYAVAAAEWVVMAGTEAGDGAMYAVAAAAGGSDAYSLMSNKLIEIIEATP